MTIIFLCEESGNKTNETSPFHPGHAETFSSLFPSCLVLQLVVVLVKPKEQDLVPVSIITGSSF